MFSLPKKLKDNFLTRGASRAFDQVNVFDNNRTWQQRTPTEQKSSFQQAGQFGGQLARGTVGATSRQLNTIADAVGSIPYNVRLQTAMLTKNAKATENALRSAENYNSVITSPNRGLFGTGNIYRSADDATKLNTIGALGRSTTQGAESVLEGLSLKMGGFAGKQLVTQGLRQGFKSQIPTIGKNALLNTGQGGLSAWNQGSRNPLEIAKTAAVSGIVGTGADIGLGVAGAGITKLGKSQIKPVYAAGPDLTKPKATLKNTNTSPISLPEKPVVALNKANNLDLGEDARARFANKAPQPEPEVPIATKVGSLTDEQMTTQLVNDLGISEQTAKKIIKENNKPAIAQNLYGSKEYIRNADNPDAYANKVMNEAKARGHQAASQNMPSKPKVGLKPTAKASIFETRLQKAISAAKKEIADIDTAIKSKGYDPEAIRQKMTLANRGEYKLTPDEVTVANLYTTRLNAARTQLQDAGYDFKGEQSFYTPQVRQGEASLPKTREELSEFGYSNARENKLGTDEIDYGATPQVDYIVRAENRDLLVQKAIDDAAKIDGRVVPEENVVQASTKLQELQKKVHDKSNSEKVLTNDTVADLNEIGKLEGYKQKTNNYKPSTIVQEPKAMLEKAGIYKNGFEQYENAIGYGNEFARQLKENNIPDEQVIQALDKAIRSRMPSADKSSIQSALAATRRSLDRQNLTPAEGGSVFAQAFRNVAKSEMFKLGKTTNFTDAKMRKVVNEQINGRLMSGAYKKNFAQNLDTFISERINSSLRGFNVVSALFEMGDIANIFSKYGVDDLKASKLGFGKVDGDSLHYSRKYGQAGAHYASDEIPQVNKFQEIFENKNWNLGKKVYEAARTTENKVLLFKYLEQHKTEMFFRAAEADYMKKGLRGGDLVDAVMEDYYRTMLPSKLLTANRVIGKAPKVLTQYLNWSLQATKRFGRTIAGADDGGVFADMTRAERIARGVGTEIVPKVAAASLLGVPIMQILGMRDFTGATEGDFSGIDEEDKVWLDTVVEGLSLSPILSVGADQYFANRRNQIADKNKAEGADYNTERKEQDKPLNVLKESANMLVPFETQVEKTKEVLRAHDKGYYENRDGRVQAEGPQGAEFVAGLVTGKNYTQTFRDYQDNPNIVSVLQGKNKPQDLLTKNETVSNLVQNFGGESTRNFKRPLSDAERSPYSQKYKDANPIDRLEILKSGRAYNESFDNFKKQSPQEYKDYIESMKDHVDPEKWNKRTNGGKDLTTFKMQADRYKRLKKDFGTAYDPIYDLSDEQAKAYAAYKSVPTGTDLALRNILNKEQWYKDLKIAREKHYDQNPFEPGTEEFTNTERVKEWDKLDDKLSTYYFDETAKEAPEWAKDYPLVYQKKAIIAKYGYDSQERKNFNKQYYEEEQAQKEQYEKAQLEVINQMREIEGEEPMSWEAYQQTTEIADTDGASTSSYSSNNSSNKSIGNVSQFLRPTQGTSMKKVSVKSQSPELRTRKSVKRKSLPKIQLKKSNV